jgi:hypothetical protein
MTKDLISKNDEQRTTDLPETERTAELEPRPGKHAAPTDDKTKVSDVDSYSSSEKILFSHGRRRRPSFIL